MISKKDLKSNMQLARVLKIDSILEELTTIYPDSSRSELNSLVEKVKESTGERFWQASLHQVIALVSGLIFIEDETIDMSASEKKIQNNTQETPLIVGAHNSTDPCSICFDPLCSSPTTQLDCLHTFHHNCLHKWLLKQNTCPTCRRYTLLDIDYPALC